MNGKFCFFLALFLFLSVSVCVAVQNPAASLCIERGNSYQARVDKAGNQYGVCITSQGKAIEEWEFYRENRAVVQNVKSGVPAAIRTLDYGTDYINSELKAEPEAYLAKRTAISSLSSEIPLSESSTSSILGASTPSSFDWRDHSGSDWITSIKNQGLCGSCWAFAAAGMAEAQVNINLNDSGFGINLSEQNLISCDHSCYNGYTWPGLGCQAGCSGGYMELTLDYLQNSGVVRESCFPYSSGATGENGSCSSKCAGWEDGLVKANYSLVSASSSAIKQAISDNGPVFAGIFACDAFDLYSGGILVDDAMAGACGGHAIALVGYNDTGGYWIGKNSWGPYWGEGGFIRIAYSESAYNDNDWYNTTDILDLRYPFIITSTDIDNDGVHDRIDNCPAILNPAQADADGDGIGDVCDACPNDSQNDIDGDGICGNVDNCPSISNTLQQDSDNDSIGDACDSCPNDSQNDIDGDGICGDVDNCPFAENPLQEDMDNDSVGDACDSDADGDNYTNATDCDDLNASINPGVPEICDGTDDNCDGQVDREYLPNQEGLCLGNNEYCNGTSMTENASNYEPQNETLDNLDNDCDGYVDEGIASGHIQDNDIVFYDFATGDKIGKYSNSETEYSGMIKVSIEDNATNSTTVEFPWNASSSTLNASMIIIQVDTAGGIGSILLGGLELPGGMTKSAYVDDLDHGMDHVCIKDASILNISEISPGCDGANETLVACDNVSVDGYTCSLFGIRYKITGLHHSGVVQKCTDADADGYYVEGGACGTADCDDNDAGSHPGVACTRDCYSGSTLSSACECTGGAYTCGGGGGGGGGGSSSQCAERWTCGNWSECSITGLRSRDCQDLNNCSTINFRPVLTMTCTYVQPSAETIASESQGMEEKTSVKVSEPVAANGTKPTKDFTAAGMLPKVNASTNSTGMLIKDVPPKKLNQAWPVILAVLLIVTLVALTAVFYPLIRSRKKIAMLSKKKQSRK